MMEAGDGLLSIAVARIEQARENIAGRALVTPLVPVGSRRTPGGNQIYLKAENLQPSGSFKIRGATHVLSQLNAEQRAKGVVAYSTGNHAQAVALASKLLGINATIVMSPDAPDFKVEATRSYGAKVVMAESSSQARREVAERLAAAEGLYLVPPYDDLEVIVGQGTIGLEIVEQVQPAAVFVPVGGGGLIAGIAAAIKQMSPEVLVIGVEPEWENDGYQSFHLGRRIALASASKSLADAIRVQTLGELTYPLIRRYVDDMVLVNEQEIAAATLLAVNETHLLVEPSGALGLAAALKYAKPLSANRPVVSIASGGNTTLDAQYHLQ